jgi:hypothetical protein
VPWARTSDFCIWHSLRSLTCTRQILCGIHKHRGDACTSSIPTCCTSPMQACDHSSPQTVTGMLRHSYSESFHGKTPQALDICLSCRRELSYFGVKVAIIEPGGFKTCVTSSDRLSSNTKMIWDKASSEVKEIYGEKFLLFCEWILGEQSQLESTILNLLLVLPAAPPPPARCFFW